jgi:protein-S-isoprenylcysteine O-methyltransferase Ste14
MTRAKAVLGSTLFFLMAPAMIAGLIPWWITRWRLRTEGVGGWPLRAVGGVLIAAGLAVLIDSFARFALEGRGTPAPAAPTQTLVVSGFYRYVRNPIYVAVASIIFGQAFLFENLVLAAYGALIALAFHIFVLVYEEPTLRQSFGARYDLYCANVPRWIPRWRAWRG